MRPKRTTGSAFCSVKEAAELLGVNVETVYRAYHRGELLGKKLGRVVLLSRADLLRVERAA